MGCPVLPPPSQPSRPCVKTPEVKSGGMAAEGQRTMARAMVMLMWGVAARGDVLQKVLPELGLDGWQ